MTWFRQVWHIFKKDIRHLRWALWVYMALIATALLLSVISKITNVQNVLTALAVMVFGMLIVGPLIHDDNPVSDAAIWRSRPISSSIVFGSKLLMLGTLLLVALFAQFVALLRYDPTSTQVANVIVQSTWPYALVLLWSAMIASQTRDLKMFIAVSFVSPIVGFLATMVLSYMLANAHWNSLFPNVRFGTMPIRIGVVLVALALLAVTYTGRIRQWKTRIAAGMTMIMLLASLTGRSDSNAGGIASTPLTSAPTVAAEYRVRTNVNPNGPMIEVLLDVNRLRGNRQLILQSATVAVRFSNGDVKRFPLSQSRSDNRSFVQASRQEVGYARLWTSRFVVAEPVTFPMYNVKWVSPDVDMDATLSALMRGTTATELAALDSGQAVFALEGTVLMLEPFEELRIANKAGASATRNGHRITRKSEMDRLGILTEWLSVVTVPNTDPLQHFGFVNNGIGKTLVLVDESTGTGLRLSSANMRYYSTGTLVLPGAEFSTFEFGLTELRARLVSREQPVEGLFGDNAYIAVIGWKNPSSADFTTPFKSAMRSSP